MRKKKLNNFILKLSNELNKCLIECSKLQHNIENDQWIHDKFFEMIDKNKEIYDEVDQFFRERS